MTHGTREMQALWYTGPQCCEMRMATMAGHETGEVLVDTLYTCVSRGTEGLVYRGEVPETEWERMRAPFQEGAFPFPVKYGYANVGVVSDGAPDLLAKTVFSLFPHQNVFSLAMQHLVPVPDQVSAKRAVLAANMETAINALWDGKPSPGDHICVVGGGVVGLLTAYVAARIAGSAVTVVDTNSARRSIAEKLGARFALPEEAPINQDLVFHTSASSAGLETALKAAGNDASVIEMSWYGAGGVLAPLGGDFHCRRLRLVSSQVGTIPAERQARWTFRRRLELALNLLADPVLDSLITHEIRFLDLPEHLPTILNKNADVLAAVVVYDQPTQ
ncbi:Alanine dehydrogenase/PNT, C-terminal domain [Roseibium denhamense]|uniref:Alanine dehydrogenase/PNT, C-terminal domain n=1 Tax=Roseibium denhamense TaxID=76305 RepID=A0ABY1PMG4_9HYPH|nr:Alanine dehydrogenase/PNT, C-terminal domain [Roseibium denhamense]